MAKIKFGMMMTDASGKLGGQVFSKNRGGSYVRTKVTPINPQSVAQSAIRSIFASISQGWSALTDAQRQSWNAAVDSYGKTDVFGDIRNPSGKNLFQRLNQNLAISNQTGLVVVGLPDAIPLANPSTALLDSANNEIGIQTSGDVTGSMVVVWATPPLSAGTRFVRNRLRQIAVITGGDEIEYLVSDEYINKFGAFTNTDNIYFGMKVINSNGQASPLQIFKAEPV